MNVYLCSTVRHLLFSLLKSIDEVNVSSTIFMISDQQNIDPERFDISCLPEHVQVVFIKRNDIRAKLYRGIKGKIIKLKANFKVSTSQRKQKKLVALLFNKILQHPATYEQLKNGKLFLFNDRNKMSRLFRLAYDNYSLIEDGLGNYYGRKVKKFQALLYTLAGKKRNSRYFGDDKRCQSIYFVNAENAPLPVSIKAKQITFIHIENIKRYLYPFFKVKAEQDVDCIIATQPLHNFELDIKIYAKLIHGCQKRKLTYAIKPHPRENISRYLKNFPNVPFIDGKLPLELIVCGNKRKVNILSICSTAGDGFEGYCNKLTLIDEHEVKKVGRLPELLNDWRDDINIALKRVEPLLERVI